MHPDHIFGAAAFLPCAPAFVGHANLEPAISARGAFYRAGLERVLGPGQAGEPIKPTSFVARSAQIDLGGRVLDLRAHPVAHTDCDLSVLDRATGTWFAGDLLFVGRVPALDGSLNGWLTESDLLAKLPVALAVPGHGPVPERWQVALARQGDYLRAVRRDVRALLAQGGDVGEAAGIAAEERERWLLFDDYNGRNAVEAFKELQWE